MKAALWSIRTSLVLGTALALAPAVAGAATIKVFEGDSIQAAVDAASDGDKILVYPGTYIEPHTSGPGVHVTKSIQLLAKVSAAQRAAGEKVILQAGPGQTDGVLAEGANASNPITGFRIKGFTVQGFPNNGIHLRYVDGFRIDQNESINNLGNGIFPTLSANGQVNRNLSYGSEDAALWVEASTDVRVLKNTVHSSPTGLQITVSNNVEVKNNEAYGNTVGIGLYHPNGASLPPLAEMRNWEVSGNYVHDNNFENTAPPGSMPASLPPGGGILVLGTDDGTFENNTVENNNFYGIAMLDWCTAVEGGPFDCSDIPPDVEPYPDGNAVQKNKFINNGTAPDPMHPLATYAADMIYILFETGHANCFGKNEFTTRDFPFVQPNVLAKCG